MVAAFASMDEVIALLETGEWEIGYADGSRGDGRFWLQRGGLSKGGETRKVRAGTAYALERRGLIEVEPRRAKQPFWLRRYRYTGSKGKESQS